MLTQYKEPPICGISGFSLSPNERPINANKLARHLLLGIEHRGTDATGAAWRSDNDIVIQKRDVTASKWVKTLSLPKKAQTAILHTRAWTLGDPKYHDNNHPIRAGEFVGVHNGTVWNHHWLFNLLDGNRRRAEVDSEAIFALLAYGDKSMSNITHDTDLLEYVEGFAAIAYMSLLDNDPNTLHVARLASSPLVIAQTVAGSFLFASEADVILDACKAMRLDLEFMDADVEEGTYFRVEQGIITEQKSFFVDDFSRWKSTPKSKAPVKVITPSTSSRIEDGGGWQWCYDCDNWENYCQCDEGFLGADRLTVFTPGDGVTEVLDSDVNTVVDRALFDVNYTVMPMEYDEWDHLYAARKEAVGDWLNRLGGKERYTDEFIMETAVRMHAFTRPGDWVKTHIHGEEHIGQVVEVPQSFPDGRYLLRVYIPRSGTGLDGMESVLVERLPTLFRDVSNVRPAMSLDRSDDESLMPF